MTLDDVGVEHHFLPHLYCKLAKIPAGMHLIQHVHTYDHASHLIAGKVLLSLNNGASWEAIEAPRTLLIRAGIAHQVVALEDSLWYCVHVTDETNVEKIDETLIA